MYPKVIRVVRGHFWMWSLHGSSNPRGDQCEIVIGSWMAQNLKICPKTHLYTDRLFFQRVSKFNFNCNFLNRNKTFPIFNFSGIPYYLLGNLGEWNESLFRVCEPWLTHYWTYEVNVLWNEACSSVCQKRRNSRTTLRRILLIFCTMTENNILH